MRGFFAYRDLGVATATGGRVGAHVIRARGASTEPGEKHRHTLEFQLVYVLRGWVEFDYDGVDRVRLEAGSSVVQPPGINHAELAHSEELEMLEMILPAHFETEPAGDNPNEKSFDRPDARRANRTEPERALREAFLTYEASCRPNGLVSTLLLPKVSRRQGAVADDLRLQPTTPRFCWTSSCANTSTMRGTRSETMSRTAAW